MKELGILLHPERDEPEPVLAGSCEKLATKELGFQRMEKPQNSRWNCLWTGTETPLNDALTGDRKTTKWVVGYRKRYTEIVQL